AGLAWIGGRWVGVIHIAPLLPQHDQLIVDATAKSIWVGVVQGPVAMDEGPLRLTGDGMSRQGAVLTDQELGEALKFLPQALFGVLVMVQMDLDFSQPLSA